MMYDAVVVGAGPAGSAAAATLAERAHRVLLVEKERFPRRKVCGAFLSADALPLLERLGVRQAVAAHAPETITEGSLQVSNSAGVLFDLPAAALGLSRLRFDELLAARARENGAEVRLATRVASIGRSDGLFRVRLAAAGQAEEVEARAVIGAWGRWDSLDRALDRGFLKGRRFFGWSREFQGDSTPLAGRVRLYLFRGGYCGLSRVEGGVVNLAGIVSEQAWSAAGAGWDGVLERARRDNRALDCDLAGLEPAPSGFLGTGPVFFTTKPPIEDGMLMAGDAAGVLDPFSGTGQSSALGCGILAAETADAALSGKLPISLLPEAYARAWKRRFARRFAWSAIFRKLMLHPDFAQLAARLAGEKLTHLGIARLWGSSVLGPSSLVRAQAAIGNH